MQDVVRFLVISLGCIVTGSVLVVVRTHYQVWRRASRSEGILPLHVWLVSVGHLCFVIGTALGAVASLETGAWSWRFCLYVVGSSCTVVSLVAVAMHLRARQ